MVKKIVLLLVLAVLLAMPVKALDNSGGGIWKRVDVFIFNASSSSDTQYCISVNGSYINITNTTGYIKASLKDPYFWSTVDSTGKDLRFTNQSSELYFWIQTWDASSKTAKIWVNVTKRSNELRMYYGNPAATTSQYLNGTKTFMFFDNFNTLSSKWVQMTGTWSVANGRLYVSSDYGIAPGNNILYTGRTFYAGKYIVYVNAIGYYDVGIDINSQGTTPSSALDIATVQPTTGTLNIAEWGGAWGGASTAYISPVYIGDTITETIYQKGGVIYQKAVDLNTHAVATNSRILTTLLTSGYIGLHVSAGFTTSTEFNWIFVVSTLDPISIKKVYTASTGNQIYNAMIVNISYNSYNISGKLLINNSTTLLTPIFKYLPSNTSNTGYIATGTTTVGGNLNITIYLYSRYSLNKVICNGTVVTPTYRGNITIDNQKYNVFNFTSPSAGELIITANVTPYTQTFNTSTIYIRDEPTLKIIQQEGISNVNSTYGADITLYINVKTKLYNVTYNNTKLNITYIGSTTKGIQKYNVYSSKIYENGLLNIASTINNLAYNTTLYADGSKNFTEILVGEPLRIVTPAVSNISIDGVKYYGSSVLTTFKQPHIAYIQVRIYNTTLLQFGLHSILLNVVWGKINITLKGYNNQIVHYPIGIYNVNYSTISTDPHTLLAGWNKLTVYYLGQPIKERMIYLNHTTQGMNVTIDINATNINSTCYNINAVSPKIFSIINLQKQISYGKFAINHSGEVIIHFANNSPATVVVKGSSYSYYPPYLYIYGKGNATITAYYILKLGAENTLGIPMNITIELNGVNKKIYGVSNKILPVNQYNIKFPKIVSGFILNNLNLTNINLNLTSNKELPTATYKVPTYISLATYKINTASFKFPIPIPFITPLSAQKGGTQKACIEGKLYNWYDVPVPNANITLKITSLKTGYTITKYVDTGTTGTFNVTFDVASDVNYSISAIYWGSNIYVKSYKHIIISGGTLPPAPSSNKYNLIVLSAIAVTVLGIGIGLLAYVLHKRSLSKAINKLNKGKYFRKIK